MNPARRGLHAPRRSLGTLALALGVAVGGCSGSVETPPSAAGLGCVDDSKQCMDLRASTLQSMMADKQRSWVHQPPSASAYASGVRLFAFKTRKRELSCDELAIGKREADMAAPTLRSAAGAGLTPAQVSRGAMLGGEVAKELGLELARRCRA